ncbi:MAG: hypothetical protein IPK05_10275 [Comamonadaceae bacterium]|nr:hypothetical protein [Comamonadaceae bacterium]
MNGAPVRPVCGDGDRPVCAGHVVGTGSKAAMRSVQIWPPVVAFTVKRPAPPVAWPRPAMLPTL